jgi:hypothetical protein
MATADHRAWEFSQKNGDVTVYMTAKNGHKREERCGIEDDMYKGYSRVVFDPCDRASSCLGAADQEGPIRKWTYSSNKLKEWHNLNATEDPEQVFLTPLARQNFSDIRDLMNCLNEVSVLGRLKHLKLYHGRILLYILITTFF